MPRSTIRDQEKCPITFALDCFGDKWSLLILRDIAFKQKRYYSEFLSAPEGIATNVLADRLLKLDAAGMLSKCKDPNNSAKFIYRLTHKSRDLLPVLLEMIAWSA